VRIGRSAAFVVIVLLVLASYVSFAVSRGTPGLALATVSVPTAPTEAPANISWPRGGQAAFTVDGSPLMLSHGAQRPSPTASVAKVMTALQVLSVKPLQAREPGPVITIAQLDVDSYRSYLARGGSVAAVRLGEHLTERQALEGLMLPSANNLADTLARWAFGSIEGYLQTANAAAASLGMAQTHIADPSGFSAETVSTAADLLKLGRAALADPALSAIVGEKTAVLPLAGKVGNVNAILGRDGIFGIKTGNTDEAGGVFLFAAHIVPVGRLRPVTLIGAVMASADLPTALASSVHLIDSVRAGFTNTAQQVDVTGPVAAKEADWGQQIQAGLAARTIPLLRFRGSAVRVTVRLNGPSMPFRRGGQVGSVLLNSGFATAEIPLIADVTPAAPASWKLLHP
jgi:D-alanyl-D-alanine carboxypeptidase (penicillin-binding protein 5/6)